VCALRLVLHVQAYKWARLVAVRRITEVRFAWLLESPVAPGIGSAPHEARDGSHGGDMPNKTALIPS
jgi:hypothetical protein